MFLFFFILLFYFILFNFTILDWFCQIPKWICHRYTCVPHPEPSSLLPPHTIPLGSPSAPAPSIQYSWSSVYIESETGKYTNKERYRRIKFLKCHHPFCFYFSGQVHSYLSNNSIHTYYYAAAAAAAATAKSLQSCPTLCDSIDGSPLGSPIPGILQARTLEWVAISFSTAWKWKVKVKSLSRVRLFATPWTVAHQAPPSMGFSRQEYWSGVPSPSPITMLHPLKTPICISD